MGPMGQCWTCTWEIMLGSREGGSQLEIKVQSCQCLDGQEAQVCMWMAPSPQGATQGSIGVQELPKQITTDLWLNRTQVFCLLQFCSSEV